MATMTVSDKRLACRSRSHFLLQTRIYFSATSREALLFSLVLVSFQACENRVHCKHRKLHTLLIQWETVHFGFQHRTNLYHTVRVATWEDADFKLGTWSFSIHPFTLILCTEPSQTYLKLLKTTSMVTWCPSLTMSQNITKKKNYIFISKSNHVIFR